MKHRKYTRRKKIWMMVIFIICLCATAAGALGFYYVNNVSKYLFSKTELIEYDTFEETETIEQKILDDTQTLFRYCLLGQVFGDQDSENQTVPLFTVQTDDGNYQMCLADLKSLYNMVQEKSSGYDSNGYDEAVVLQDGTIFPVPQNFSAHVIYDYVLQKETSENTYFDILYIRGAEYLNNYYDLKNQMAPEETNLSYAIIETGGSVMVTNMTGIPEEGDDISAAAEQVMKLDSYVYFDNATHRLFSNMEKAEVNNSGLDDTAAELAGTTQGVSFAVGLDTAYPVHDEYRAMSVNYRRCRPILLVSIPLSVVGMIGSLICFLYLLASVGHQEDFDEIRLDKFDQWPTEPSFLLLIGGIFAFNALSGTLAKICAKVFFTSDLIYYFIQILSVIVSAIIGMVGFFSLVKRLKAGVVWKHSITRKLLKNLGRKLHEMLSHWQVSARVMGLILIYWLVTVPLAMSMAAFSGTMPLWLLIMEAVVFIAVQFAAAVSVIWIYIKRKDIQDGVDEIAYGDLEYEIDTKGMFPGDRQLAEGINNIGVGLQDALDQAVRSERMKADLITNVSHDIKTPLTSIINYVDLMKREKVDNENIARYIQILDEKSNRLKVLTEDLVEASRASSGNITLQMGKINYVELVRQACGEFEERFDEIKLQQILTLPDKPAYIYADGRRIWRILENLFSNTRKYAMPGTRVYISVTEKDGYAAFSMKNISEFPLNISPEELTERFTRGDTSRTTEGSGLGLSIAKSLTELQGGYFDIYLNGDLYQVTVEFELYDDSKIKQESAN